LIVTLLVLGICFRFYNLERKNYWNDEVYTSLRISGYTKAELVEQVANRAIASQDWQTYQRINPEKDLSDTIASLIEDVHPPLYFLLARFWAQAFGSSVAVMRSLAAALSLLVFPCLYWLCLELFESPSVGWVALALMAVSPFHVLYAQEARQYSLWTVTILLSSASLLWAIRRQRLFCWVIYGATVALGLYVHYFSVLVLIAHGIYIGATKGVRSRKTVKAFLLASLGGILACLPWLLVAKNFGGAAYTARKMPLLTVVQRWALNISSLFFDAQISYREPLFDVRSGDEVQLRPSSLSLYLILLILVLVGYSIYFLCRQTPKRVWMFVLTLIGFETLILLLPDIVSGGQRSTISRYLIPCYTGIQLAVAYFLTVKMTANYARRWQQQLWQIVAVVLVSLGILSCAISSQAPTWWNKYSSYYEPQVASIINQAVSPLVVVEDPIRLMGLSYLLSPNVKLQLVKELRNIQLSNGFNDIFLFRASEELQRELEQRQHYRIKPVYELGYLWRLEINH
jgi:uncharacterized membrane protein